jgi:hypothetical protein
MVIYLGALKSISYSNVAVLLTITFILSFGMGLWETWMV